MWEGRPADEPGGLRLEFVSAHAERMFGHPASAWLAGDGLWARLVHPDDRESVLAARSRAVYEGRDHELEYRCRASDGRQLWVREVVHRCSSPEGEPPRFGGFIVDVTARREAEALTAAVIDAAPEGFALFDTGFRYLHVNAALARINGVAADAHLGLTPAEVLAGFGETEVLEPLRRVLATGEAIADLEVAGTTPAAPDYPRTWLVSYFPIRGATGAIARLGAIVTDITDRKRAEERAGLLAELGAILDEVVELDERLDRFVHALVPRLGDSCTVTLRQLDGGLRRAAVAHVDPDGERAVASLPPVDDRTLGQGRTRPLGTLVIDETAAAGEPAGDPEQQELRSRYLAGLGILAPMHAGGRAIGHLSITRSSARRWTPHEVELVEELARRAAVTVETARLYDSQRAARDRMSRLQAVTASLSEALTPSDVATAVLEEGMGSVGASMAAVWQVDADGLAFELVGHRGWRERTSRTPMQRIDASADLPVPDAVRTRRPVWLPDLEAKAAAYPALAQRAVGASPEALYIVPLSAGSEPVGALALCFDDPARLDGETKAFVAALAAQCAQALERARLYESERHVAGILQRSLLPARMPQVRGAEFAVRYLPAAGLEAGGDFYEALRLPSGAIGVAVGDVVGRGPAAAAVMGQLRSALRAYALEGASPGGVLARLSAFAETVEGGLAATAAYAVIDEQARTLRYACAGHPYPVLAHADGSAVLLRGGREVPLGVTPESRYPEAEVSLEPGATLLLYTDGLVERRGEHFEGAVERLRAIVGSVARAPLSRLLDEVIAREDAESLLDDVALLAVRLSAEPDVVRRTRIPADPTAVAGARADLRSWLADAGVPEERLTDILLAAGEAVANAVEHAYAGGPASDVTVELRHDGRTLELSVTDRGRWRERPGDPERGRGFALMRALMSHVEIQRFPNGTRVALRAPLQGEPAAPAAATTPTPAGLDRDAGGGMMVRLTGDLDLATAPEVGERLAALAPSGRLVADLTGVAHLDSTGLRMLLETARRAGGRLTVVAPPSSAARRAIDVAGAGAVFTVRDA